MSHPLTPEEIEQLLPLYVCGECTDDERGVIEQAVANDPALKEQFYELRSTLGLLTEGINDAPAPTLNTDRKNALLALGEPPVAEAEDADDHAPDDNEPESHQGVFPRWWPGRQLGVAAGVLLCASVVGSMLLPTLNSAKMKSADIALKQKKRMEAIEKELHDLDVQSSLNSDDSGVVLPLASESRPDLLVDANTAGGPSKMEQKKRVYSGKVLETPSNNMPSRGVVAPGAPPVAKPVAKKPMTVQPKTDSPAQIPGGSGVAANGVRLDYWTEKGLKDNSYYFDEFRKRSGGKLAEDPKEFFKNNKLGEEIAQQAPGSHGQPAVNGFAIIDGIDDGNTTHFERITTLSESKEMLKEVFEEKTIKIVDKDESFTSGDFNDEIEIPAEEVELSEDEIDIINSQIAKIAKDSDSKEMERSREEHLLGLGDVHTPDTEDSTLVSESEKTIVPMTLPPASQFKVFPVNPFVMTSKDRLSTFALETDTASYTLGRSYIRAGYRPPAGSVRMEEYINAFDYAYSPSGDKTFRVHSQVGSAPFGENLALVKIGVKGRVIGRDSRKSAHVVLAVDTSGSMAQADRLPMIKRTLSMLVNNLADTDTVSVVSYGNTPELALDHASVKNKASILRAIQQLEATGPTNLMQGINLAYQRASHYFRADKVNRVVLCSDGVATIGEVAAESMLKQVDGYRKQGIFLTVAGFGTGAYNDGFMETLANKGDGNYTFIDSLEQAKTVFVKQLDAALFTIAKDVKIQVDFNPDRVRRYRLIGYENRDIADDKFRDDTVDAGEVGSGQSATALYEVELVDGNRDDLATVAVRYKDLDSDDVEEISHRVRGLSLKHKPVADYPYYYLAACAAEWAEILRNSEHVQPGSEKKVEMVLREVANALPHNDQVKSLLRLVSSAKGLPQAP